jgi:hypothetical protein
MHYKLVDEKPKTMSANPSEPDIPNPTFRESEMSPSQSGTTRLFQYSGFIKIANSALIYEPPPANILTSR